MSTIIYLIRHAQTDSNLARRYSGLSDVPLNSCGRKQAAALARRFKSIRVDRIYASDRRRACQTARIVFPGRRFEKRSELREMNFGVFEGLTFDEIRLRYPALWRRWIKFPYRVRIPRGETLACFQKRVVRGMKRVIADNRDAVVAVVSHGAAISAYLNHILKTRKFWKYIPVSTAMSILECRNGTVKILVKNDSSHLDGKNNIAPRRRTQR